MSETADVTMSIKKGLKFKEESKPLISEKPERSIDEPVSIVALLPRYETAVLSTIVIMPVAKITGIKKIILASVRP